MYKIIDLDIDGTLTGDTRVSEIAMVESPAIEQNFIYFAEEKSYIVPQNVSSKACKARKHKEENGSSCGTNTGWVRSSQLCDRKPITLDTVKRMYSYLSRHEVDLESSKSYEDGCGLLMWDAWGGEPGYEWSKRIVEREQEMDIDVSGLPEYVNYPTGSTENDMLIEDVGFIEKIPYETKDDYISRCVEWHIKNKGWSKEQSYAVCIEQANQDFGKGQKVSFDYDVVNTPKGRGLVLSELQSGSEVYIVGSYPSMRMKSLGKELGIDDDNIYSIYQDDNMVRWIRIENIVRHYTDKEEILNELGRIGQDFNCPCFDMSLDDTIQNSKEDFNYVDIDGCECIEHKDGQGNCVYVPRETEPVEEQSFGIEEYSEEEKHAALLLKELKDRDTQSFERIVGELRGASATQLRRRNHPTPTPYYLYKKLDSGEPTRDFCNSIEGRYFRRFEIDLLTDRNTEFGHNRLPYSKWLYKGGPNCVHGWVRVVVIGNNITEAGSVPGLPGTPPKRMPNQGYYSEETKRRSQVAYIIEQKKKGNFTTQKEKRMVYSPLMIPNILIPRMDDNNEKYFVRFTPESIEKMQQLYMIEKRQDKTNYEHSEKKIPSVVMVESWIVSGDNDKAYELGFKRDDIPVGTWMGGFKVMDTEEGNVIWNDFIKTGKLKGFSVEGDFLLKFSRQKTDEYLLEEIINTLKSIND